MNGLPQKGTPAYDALCAAIDVAAWPPASNEGRSVYSALVPWDRIERLREALAACGISMSRAIELEHAARNRPVAQAQIAAPPAGRESRTADEIAPDAGQDVKWSGRWYTPLGDVLAGFLTEGTRAMNARRRSDGKHITIFLNRGKRYEVQPTPLRPCQCPRAQRTRNHEDCACGLTAREFTDWAQATDLSGYCAIATCMACGDEHNLEYGQDLRRCPTCGSGQLIFGGQ